MTLPASVTRHHTAWVHCDDCRPHPVRYAVDGDRMVCFGEALPSSATNGSRVSVTVHEIAGGQTLAEISSTLQELAADDVDPNTLLDLLEHVSLGRTVDEVAVAIERHRHRRLVAIG